MTTKIRNNASADSATRQRRCPSRLFDRAPLAQPPAQAARTLRQHIGWVFHH